jgi:hypothetical protein
MELCNGAGPISKGISEHILLKVRLLIATHNLPSRPTTPDDYSTPNMFQDGIDFSMKPTLYLRSRCASWPCCTSKATMKLTCAVYF